MLRKIIVLIGILSCQTLLSVPLSEEQKIDALISQIQAANATFIRNGKEYSAVKAGEHLRSKLAAAQRSFFSPPKKDWTAELFIQKVASKSSISGKPYQVKLSDGKTMNAEEYLTKELRKIEALSSSERQARSP